MFTIYLKESDMLTPKHFPVIATINEGCNSNFEAFIDNICNDIGYSGNYGDCTFWNDLDEYDHDNTEYYIGAEFSTVDDESIIISYNEILYYIRIVCDIYTVEHPESISNISTILATYKTKHNL